MRPRQSSSRWGHRAWKGTRRARPTRLTCRRSSWSWWSLWRMGSRRSCNWLCSKSSTRQRMQRSGRCWSHQRESSLSSFARTRTSKLWWTSKSRQSSSPSWCEGGCAWKIIGLVVLVVYNMPLIFVIFLTKNQWWN